MITIRQLTGGSATYDYLNIERDEDGTTWNIVGHVRKKSGTDASKETIIRYQKREQAERTLSTLTTERKWKHTNGVFTVDHPKPTTIAQHLAPDRAKE